MSSFSDDYGDGCDECHDTGALCADGFCEACHGMQCGGEPFDGEHDDDDHGDAAPKSCTPELITALGAALEQACLDCGAPMLLGYAPAEWFNYRSPYADLCSNRPACRAFASARPNGTLAGVPAAAATRKLRRAYHVHRNRILGEARGALSKRRIKARFYLVLQRQLGMTAKEVHAGISDGQTMERMIERLEDKHWADIDAWYEATRVDAKPPQVTDAG